MSQLLDVIFDVRHQLLFVAACFFRKSSYLVLKDCRLRASFADQDTLGTPATLASCEYYAHVLDTYSDVELQAVVAVANGEVLCCPSECIQIYKEIQLHGDLRLDRDVLALVCCEDDIDDSLLVAVSRGHFSVLRMRTPSSRGFGIARHTFQSGTCMICPRCLACTGYGRQCRLHRAGRRGGEECGCGGDKTSGCLRCGLCSQCASTSACSPSLLARPSK